MIVGRATLSLSIKGDFFTKYDNLQDVLNVPGAPHKAIGDLHGWPREDPDFNWRIRCYVDSGVNLPTPEQIVEGQ